MRMSPWKTVEMLRQYVEHALLQEVEAIHTNCFCFWRLPNPQWPFWIYPGINQLWICMPISSISQNYQSLNHQFELRTGMENKKGNALHMTLWCSYRSWDIWLHHPLNKPTSSNIIQHLHWSLSMKQSGTSVPYMSLLFSYSTRENIQQNRGTSSLLQSN